MLLKIPGSIEIDDVERVKNIRLNIPNKHQFRLKCTMLQEGNIERDLDIVCREIKCMFHGTNVGATIIGVDMITKLSVNVTITYNLFKKETHIKGVISNKEIDQSLTSFKDLITLLNY